MAEICHQIIHAEPPTMQKSVDKDLQAIIAQCLEKDPNRRYQSAIGLLDDLQAWQNGHVVTARKTHWPARLIKKIKHNPIASLAILGAVTAITFSLGYGVWQNFQTLEQIKQSEQFIHQAQEIKSRVRRAHMLPLHNVQAEYQSVKDAINALKAQIQNSPVAGSAASEFALGSAYQSVWENDQALNHLRQAEAQGWDSPELSSSLGQAHALEWRHKTKEAKSIKTPEEKEVFLNQAKTKHYDQAIKHLGKAQTESKQSAYLAGYLAYTEERWDDAISHFNDELSINPWHYEAHRLIAEAYTQKFDEEGSRIGYDKAMEYIEMSNLHLDLAIETGRSDPLNYVTRCTGASRDVQVKRFLKRHQEIPSVVASGIEICEAALTLEPNAFSPWANLSTFHRTEGEWLEQQDQDPTQAYQDALAVIHRGLEKHPDRYQLYTFAVKPLDRLAQAAIDQGQSPIPNYEKAIEMANAANALRPNSTDVLKELARIHWGLGDYYFSSLNDGEAGEHHLTLAFDYYSMANEIRSSVATHLNMALVQKDTGLMYADLGDISQAIELLQASIERRIEHIPNRPAYFSFYLRTIEDLNKLMKISDANNLTALTRASVQKYCEYQDLDDSQTAAFLEVTDSMSATENFTQTTHCDE